MSAITDKMATFKHLARLGGGWQSTDGRIMSESNAGVRDNGSSAGSVSPEASPRLACLEIRGGNHEAHYSAELPGLEGWVSCRPLRPAAAGGDLYYLSLCSHGEIARITLADIAGHGETVSSAALRLRDALREHADEWDLTLLIKKLNDTFLHSATDQRVEYATAFIIGYYAAAGELLFTNAGHPPPLWFHSSIGEWTLLSEATPWSKSIDDLPLGMIPGTDYSQTAVQLALNDMLLLYTDGVSECANPEGEQLGEAGLLKLARSLPASDLARTGEALREALDSHRGGTPSLDDETFVLLRRTPPPQAPWDQTA